jgi:hypothetical protein
MSENGSVSIGVRSESEKGRITIKLSPRSTVLLPDESNADDDHDHTVYYCSDHGRGPYWLLSEGLRHGVC